MATIDLIQIVETAYDLSLPDEAWIQRLCDVASPLLDQGLGTTLFRYRVDDACGVHIERFAQHGGSPGLEKIAVRLQTQLPPEWVEDVYLTPGTMGSSSEVLPKQLRKGLLRDGALPFDVMGLNVSHRPGYGLVLSAPMVKSRRASDAERRLWMKLLPHVRAGLRLRAAIDRHQSIDEADAVFAADGRLVQAACVPKSAQERLRARVVSIDRARGALRGTDPHGALGIWEGLVDGTWSMVDAFDTDGRRYVVARRNPPHAPDPRGLTPRECQVATLVATGATNQEVAYELGLSPSTVSTLLQRAARKLRVANRVELCARLTSFWRADALEAHE